MADFCYFEVSLSVTEKVKEWAFSIIELVEDILDEKEKIEGQYLDDAREFLEFIEFKTPQFELSEDNGLLKIDSESVGSPKHAAFFIQALLKKFQILEPISFGWSEGHGTDYSGGGCVVTIDEIYYFSVREWLKSALLEIVTKGAINRFCAPDDIPHYSHEEDSDQELLRSFFQVEEISGSLITDGKNPAVSNNVVRLDKARRK